jgi:hypothetical protein
MYVFLLGFFLSRTDRLLMRPQHKWNPRFDLPERQILLRFLAEYTSRPRPGQCTDDERPRVLVYTAKLKAKHR